MIVQKPQFDMDNIKIGTAYWLESFKKYDKIYDACLITGVSPFQIVVNYYNTHEKEFEEMPIKIESIIKKDFILTPMEVVKNG